MKLPHYQQMMLFDSRPETFAPMRSGRMLWSYVKFENLADGELADLLMQSWRTAALQKLAAATPAQKRERENQA